MKNHSDYRTSSSKKFTIQDEKLKPLVGAEKVAQFVRSYPTYKTQDSTLADDSDNRIAFTEIHDFVSNLKADEEVQKPNAVKLVDSGKDEQVEIKDEDDMVQESLLHYEPPIGTGLVGALKWLTERGTLK